MLTTRSNYDNSGLSTGLAASDLFADLELRLIANRKKLFKDAIKGGDNFRDECIRRFKAYDEASRAAVTGTLNELSELTGREISRAYNAGINGVDRDIAKYKEQGFKPDKEPDNKCIDIKKLTFASSVLQMFMGVASYAKQAADNQLKYIVAQVNPNADNLMLEIDNAQSLLLTKGIPGKSLATGAEKAMTAEAEFIMRNQSAEALRTAKGERRAEYGLKYVRVSAHPSSCPLCIPWQNKVLIDDRYGGGSGGKYELLSTAVADGFWHFNCYDKETEVLTSAGWKLFKDLNGSELIYTLNKETEQTEWHKPLKYFKQYHSGKMVYIKSATTDLMVTPDHNMLYRTQKNKKLRFKKAIDITKSDSFFAGQKWKGDDSEYVSFAETKVKSATLSKFLAYYIADGSMHSTGAVKIAQQNNEWMYHELCQLPFKVWKDDNKIVVYSKPLVHELSKLGKCTEKYVPSIIKNMSSRLINIFLNAYLKTDGYIAKDKPMGKYISRGHKSLFTTSGQLAADLGELALKAGYRPSYHWQKAKGKAIKFRNGIYTPNKDICIINLNTRTGIYKTNKALVEYNDYVYCVEVPNNTVLVRRNGKVMWCGNCRHEVTEEIPGYSNPNRNDYYQASPRETAKRYAVEQQQRYNERNIRAYKIQAEGSMDATKQALAEQKVREWQSRQRALEGIAEREGVPFYRQYDREQIGGDTKPTIKPYAQEIRKTTSFNEKSFQAFYESAIKIEPTVTSDLKTITEEAYNAKLQGLDFKTKTPESSIRKIKLTMQSKKIDQSHAEELQFDTVRYTQVSEQDGLYTNYVKTVASLEKRGYNVVDISNTWIKPEASYKGVNVKILNPDGGKFELQFHTPESLAAKEATHILYERQRVLPPDSNEAKRLAEEMKKIAASLTKPKNINKIQ